MTNAEKRFRYWVKHNMDYARKMGADEVLAALDEARKLVSSLASRIVSQSELLSKRAEKKEHV